MRRHSAYLWLACLGPGLLGVGIEGAELTGILRDNLGHGLGNLTVKASYYDSVTGSIQLTTLTDATGHFSLSGEDGLWSIEVAPAELSARGYLSVSSQDYVSDGTSIRLATRKLDFTHRIAGRLVNEAGQPLAGYALRARITENNSFFETNVLTAADGTFLVAATPAVWTFLGLVAPAGVSTVRVFGDQPVEVEVTNLQKQVTLTAPVATSTILVTATNLGGWDIAVGTEAFGQSYQLLKPVPTVVPLPGGPQLAFEVFNGAWRVFVTNSDPARLHQSVTLPAPLLVTVTNQSISVTMAGITTPATPQYVQRVRLVTATGAVVTNAALSVSSGTGFPNYPFPPQPQPPPPSGAPGVYDLSLAAGRWTIIATTRGYPVFAGWDVSREVLVTSNQPLPEITLVFPEPGVGPRISGTLSASGGPPPGSHLVSYQLTDNGTNYLASLLTDVLGQFGTNVPPGHWQVQTYANCPLASIAVVSNQDVEVNFAFLIPVAGETIPVSLSVVDDRGESAPDDSVSLIGFDYLVLDGDSLLSQPLQPAIWEASLYEFNYSGATPSYRLNPTLRWQLPPGAPATNLVLVKRHTTSRIEGQLRDEQGRLLLSGNAAAWTSENGTNFVASGAIASGYFSLNVFPGEWSVGAAVWGNPVAGALPVRGSPSPPVGAAPPPNLYTRPAPRFVRVSNDVARCDFVVTNVPARVTLVVTVIREDGGHVGGLNVVAYGPVLANGPVATQYSPTDLSGRATLSVAPGLLRISTSPSVYEVTADPQLWPSLYTEVSASSNHFFLVARRPRTCIPGAVINGPSLGLQPQIFASTEINSTNYTIMDCPDADGEFCVPVFPGQWTVRLSAITLPSYGLQTVAPREVTVPPSGASPRADFTLLPIAGDFRTARLSHPEVLPDGRFRLELQGQAPLSWRIERSENLRDWTSIAIQSAPFPTLIIEDSPEPSRRAAFYRAVWVR